MGGPVLRERVGKLLPARLVAGTGFGNRIETAADLVHRGRRRGRLHTGVRRTFRLFRQQARCLLNLAGILGHFLLHTGEGLARLLRLLLSLEDVLRLGGDFRVLGGDLLVKIPPGVFRLFQLPAQPFGCLPVVGAVVFQNEDVAVEPDGLLILGGRCIPQAVGFGRKTVHLREIFLCPPADFLYLFFDLLISAADHENPIVVLAQDFCRPRQRMQPQADFQPAALFFIFQILLRLFCLLPERPDARFKLAQNIAQAQEVFLSLPESALRVLLTVTEPGDPGGLLKDLAPILRSCTDDTVDFALSDDGVPVAPEACIHEKLVDVAQADSRLIEQVLAVARAVITARHGDGVAVKGKLAAGIIDC